MSLRRRINFLLHRSCAFFLKNPFSRWLYRTNNAKHHFLPRGSVSLPRKTRTLQSKCICPEKKKHFFELRINISLMQMCHRWAWHERQSGVRVGRPKQTKVDAEFVKKFFFIFFFQVYTDGIEGYSSRTKLFEGWFQEENRTFSWVSKGQPDMSGIAVIFTFLV